MRLAGFRAWQTAFDQACKRQRCGDRGLFAGTYDRFGDAAVHDGLDLEVRRGEILGVVGGSGTGKSVMLKCALGLMKPDKGDVFFNGQSLTTGKAAKKQRDMLTELQFYIMVI